MTLAQQAGNTLAATVEVSEMMGSEVHFHLSAVGRDVVVIVPTVIDSVKRGDTLELAFDGSVCHVFGADGDNLEK